MKQLELELTTGVTKQHENCLELPFPYIAHTARNIMMDAAGLQGNIILITIKYMMHLCGRKIMRAKSVTDT